MTPQKPETAVQQQVVVEAPIEAAFRIFTEKFDLIKPREHNLLPVPPGVRQTVKTLFAVR